MNAPILTILIGVSTIAQTDLSKAELAIRDGNLEQAESILLGLTQQHPNDVDYLQRLAEVQVKLDKHDFALISLTQAVQLKPKDEPLAIKKAQLLARKENWAGTIATLRMFRRSAHYDTCKLLGLAYYNIGRFFDAAWFLERAVRLKPNALEDLLLLGAIHLDRELPALAVRALESALQLEPSAQNHFLLAQAYYAADRALGRLRIQELPNATARSTYKDVFVIRPVDDQPQHFEVSSANCAAYHAYKAKELGMQTPQLELLLADVWYQAREYTQARYLYAPLETQLTDELKPQYHERFGDALFWLEDIAGYEKQMSKAIKLDPDTYLAKQTEMHSRIAEFYCLRGNADRYIEYLKKAVDSSPRDQQLHYRLGNALYETDQLAESVMHFRHTLQLDPHHPDAERILAVIEELYPKPTPELLDDESATEPQPDEHPESAQDTPSS